MHLPQTEPQSNDDFEALSKSIASLVDGNEHDRIERDRRAEQAGRPTPPPRPVAPKAGVGGELWGPSNPRVTSPLQMLAEVADHAQKLHEQMLQLTGAITGEAPPPLRLRTSPRPGGGLLPAIGLLAHEIETVHVEIAGLIGHLRGRL